MKSRAKSSVAPKASGASKSSGDFLFEIGCEEIPAGMIAKAARELKAILANASFDARTRRRDDS